MRLRTLFTVLIALLAAGALSVAAVHRAPGDREHEHESLADMGRELQEPTDALLARDLSGSDPGIDYGAAFTRAAAASATLGRATARTDPKAAGASWSFKGPFDIG